MRTHYGPWQPCWISNQHQKHKSGRGPSSEHFWQVWLKSLWKANGRTEDYPWQKLTWPMARWAKNNASVADDAYLTMSGSYTSRLHWEIWRFFFNKYTNFNELSLTRHEINKWKIWHMILYKYIQWNLSNPTYQGTREMCRTVQDVRTCLILHTKGPGKCVGLYRMSEPV